MKADSRIYVAGHRGLVGSAIVRKLQREGHTNILTRPRTELDLLDQKVVLRFFQQHPLDFVFLAAARVGGIHANATYPTEFLYENLMIATNVIRAAAVSGIEKLLFLGSSCVYPRNASQPMHEESLLSGPLEPTNEAYAIAKIVGLKLCEYYNREHGRRFISAMPTNLYGPGDNFHPLDSHVIPGMMRRFHQARVSGSSHVEVWGSGQARREFLYVDDLAEALYVLMQAYEEPSFVNVGTGQDCTIAELAETMKKVTQFQGTIEFDRSKPDGAPQKLLDVTRIHRLGWRATTPLAEGLRRAYAWALENGVFFSEAQVNSTSGALHSR